MNGVSSEKTVVCRRCGSPARAGMIRCRECGELFVSVVLKDGGPPLQALAEPQVTTAGSAGAGNDSGGGAAAETWTGFVLETPTVPGSKPDVQPAGTATSTDSRPYIRCECGKKVRLRLEHAGRKVKCPACGQVHRAPKDVKSAESESVLDSAAHAPQSPSDSGSWASGSSVSGILVPSAAPTPTSEATTPIQFAAPVFAVEPAVPSAQPEAVASPEIPQIHAPEAEMPGAAFAPSPPAWVGGPTPGSVDMLVGAPAMPALDAGNAVTWTEFAMQAPPAVDFTPPPASVSPVLATIICDCGKKIRPRIEHSGKKIKCPGCRKVHQVPAVAGPATVPEAPVPKLAEAILDLEKAEAPPLPKDDRKKTLKWLKLRSLSAPLTRKKKDITSSIEADARKNAIDELGKSNDPRAAALIRPFLQDEWVGVREAAATALGRLGDRGRVVALAKLLTDESPEVRRAAAVSLGILGDPRAVRPLLLLAVEQPQLRFSATEAIAKLGPSAVKPLTELADVSDPGIRAETAVALGKTLSVSALEPLGRLLRDPHAVVRAFAAEAAGRGALAEALPLLIAACGDPSPAVRINACVALGAIGDKQAAGTLISLLHDADGDVRTKAVVALCELKPPEAIPYLHPLLASDDPDLRCRIAEALGKMGDTAAIDALLPLLGDPHAAVRMRAAAALGDLHAPQAIEPILQLLAADTNETLRQRCAEALGEIRDPRAIKPLEALAVSARGIETRMAAYRSLGHIRHPDAIEFLEQALHSDFTIRCRAVIALGEIGDSRALPGLLAMLRDPASEVRHHAAVALGEIGDANALKSLEDRLNHEEDPMVRRGLAKALTQLGDPRGEKLLDENRSVRVKRELKRRLAKLVPIGLRDQFEEVISGIFAKLSNPRRLLIYGGGGAATLVVLAAVGWLLLWMFGRPAVYRAGQTAAVAIGPQGRVFVAGTLDALSVFDPKTGQRVASQRGHLKGTYCMDFSSDGSLLATGGEDHLVRIRDGSTGKQRLELQGHQTPVTAVRFSRDGSELISLSADGVLIRWDASSGSQKGGLELPAIRGTVGFSPDLKLVAVGQADGTVHLISTSDGNSAAVLKSPFPVQIVVYNPEGSMIAATAPTSKGAIAVWEASGKSYGTPEILVSKGALGFASLAFSPDGKQLLAGGAGEPDAPATSLLWDVQTGKSTSLEGGLPSFTSVAWSPDGRMIAGGGIVSANVFVWDPASGHLLKTLTPPPER